MDNPDQRSDHLSDQI